MVGTLLSAALLLAGAAVTAASLAGAPSASSGSSRLELNWTISSGEVAPTQHAAQAALLVNGAWRGPLVEALEGDTVVLTLHNTAPSPVCRESEEEQEDQQAQEQGQKRRYAARA